MIDPQILLDAGRNTIALERDVDLQQALFAAFSTAQGLGGGLYRGLSQAGTDGIWIASSTGKVLNKVLNKALN